MSTYLKTGLLLFLFWMTSCVTEDDIYLTETVEPNPDAGVAVQDFMWKAMNFWYFWQAEVDNLADDRFPNTSQGSRDYTQFLLSEGDDPGKFFDKQLLFDEDRFSFYNDDYVELTQALSGISKSNGMEFGLVRVPESNDLVGYVRYIVPNSDAATKTIRRGDLFTGVNGTTLTDSNYLDLLFGSSATYTLNMANVVDGKVVSNGEEVTLTKQDNLQENPIFLDEIIETGGKKIAYLVYNGFTNEFDEQLNDVFGRFKSGGVTDLVLDLRYNPGGSVNTSRLLSSMIYGTNTKDVFLKARYNEKYQKILEDRNTDVQEYFAAKTGSGTPINSLKLKKVYVLTTQSSASASELVINGLEPYMDVVQIGEKTRGKNEFSVTMVDDRDNNYLYSPKRVNKIASDNRWAIQPLLGRNENADGFSDYTAGLEPDITLREDLSNLGNFGDLNEPLLAKAIREITGTATAKTDFSVALPMETVTSSKLHTPMGDTMYVTDIPIVW
ncbi:S41 family peptidase [Pricia sp. S334]|uniref:S41 family peptidase n=1 Tax=Pricia mediterranea TaxID=3076079 RepID=A0ABU3L9C1_9FLAO|nr:S41 family peptidase [Pricia sp. S334]MDT7830280.1 S41 family peptidase [Pricia sp. S334]